MKILYVGDITGKLGRRAAAEVLPALVADENVDYVIAQGENVSHGKGLSTKHKAELEKAGVNFFTGGNHSITRTESFGAANVIRPANLKGVAGKGFAYGQTPFGNILIISLEGKIVGMNADKDIDNPLTVVDSIIEGESSTDKVATIINFHGDYSSEKVVIGQYLDGRATAVIGDHWHVPTADAQVLPGGTAHITDVGMVGSLDSSLGVETGVIIERWLTNEPSRNIMEENGRLQFNAVLIDVDTASGKARDIRQIRQILS